MKKTLLILAIMSISIFANSQKTTFEKILFSLSNELVRNNSFVENVFTQEFIINSTSNEAFLGGKSREAIKITLPFGTIKWVYRVTILDKKTNYKYEPNEELYYTLLRRESPRPISNNSEKINTYLFNHSGDVNTFLERKDNFNYISNYSVLNTTSYYGECSLTDQNVWLGFQNLSGAIGVKLILEVVAFTSSNNNQFREQGQKNRVKDSLLKNENKIKEAKDLLDLGVISKDEYNKVIEKNSTPITKQEAIDKLKEAKKQLDNGQMKQQEYDSLKVRLTPIILKSN